MSVYRQQVVNKVCPSEYEAVCKARNVKHVENVQVQKRSAKRISIDPHRNLILLADQIDSIYQMIYYPDIAVFCGNDALMKECDKLLQIKPHSFYLTYDTTFCLGDFYLTMIAFRHSAVQSKPAVPLAFMLHERKKTFYHENFLRCLKGKLPHLVGACIPVIVDREKAITNAFNEVFPSSKLIYCWNHIKSDVKHWVRTHGGKSDDVKVYHAR